MKKFVYSALMILSVFVVVSCKTDEKDTTGPVITLLEPEEGEEFRVGDANGVHMEFDIADASGLGAYKIEIHDASGHTHTATKASGASYSFQKVYEDAKGLKNHHVHVHSDSIPADAKLGACHLLIFAADVHGNESWTYTTINLVDHEVESHHDD